MAIISVEKQHRHSWGVDPPGEVSSFKHLPGKHDQKRHAGWRGQWTHVTSESSAREILKHGVDLTKTKEGVFYTARTGVFSSVEGATVSLRVKTDPKKIFRTNPPLPDREGKQKLKEQGYQAIHMSWKNNEWLVVLDPKIIQINKYATTSQKEKDQVVIAIWWEDWDEFQEQKDLCSAVCMICGEEKYFTVEELLGLKYNKFHSATTGRFISGSGVQGFSTAEEGKEFLSTHYGNWKANLSTKQKAGMAFYQSPGYELMNGQLRGHNVKASPKDLANAKEATKHLKSAINSAPPLTKPTDVYRGFSEAQFGKLKNGMVLQDKGFTSTSLTELQAGSFSGKGKQVLAKITLPVGTKAAGGSAKELVLAPNTKLKVTSVKPGGKQTLVELEVVP